jgi:hypothetical protein
MLSCGGSDSLGPAPVVPAARAGWITLTWHTPNPDDGAALLTVSGGPIDSVAAAGSHELFSAPQGTNRMRVMVFGTLASGELMRVHVPDTLAKARYTGKLEQVAARSSYALRASLGSYVVNVP